MLVAEIERTHGEVIELRGNYYWELGAEAAFLSHEAPTATDVCDLEDDVTSTLELLNRPTDEIVVVWHDLSHLIGILRIIAAMDLPTWPDPTT